MELPYRWYQDIMAMRPCYDPVERGYCTPEWTGTALNVLLHPDIIPSDKLWLVLRTSWLPQKLLHEFGLWCAQQILSIRFISDARILRALRTKRLWINNKVTDKEMFNAFIEAKEASDDMLQKILTTDPNDGIAYQIAVANDTAAYALAEATYLDEAAWIVAHAVVLLVDVLLADVLLDEEEIAKAQVEHLITMIREG